MEEELTEFCRSESISLDGLREIIERHNAAQNNNKNDITKYDFFIAACDNESVTEGVIRCLLEYFPNAARAIGEEGRLPLHVICSNKNVTLGLVELLIDAFPDSLRHETSNGCMPIHQLCRNNDLDDGEGGLKILELLIMRYPESVRRTATQSGMFPLHFAARRQSPEFCRILIEVYPGSERITNDNGTLPFHRACGLNTVATAKYLYQLYPESINVAANVGSYPIHFAINGIRHREDNAVEMVQFLLDCDPNVVLQKYHGAFPLYWVCIWATNDDTRRLNTALKVLQILYDAHPEAIESNEVTSNVGSFCAELQAFINTQLTYARQARDRTLMHSQDENGQLPLHKALRGNVTLGSIKLLFKGNPSAITCADNKGRVPLHVACQQHESASVIEYLISLNKFTLTTAGREGNTALHHACRGANHAIISLLLDKYGAVSVSKRNVHGQLPIDLLFASREVSDRESTKYTESIYRLLRAYPITLMHYDLRQAGSEDCISRDKKKRKVDEL